MIDPQEHIDAIGTAAELVRAHAEELRCWTDYLTGTVGRARAISYTMLAEECETAIAKGAGWQRVQPTRKALRVALASLERAGLLRRLDDDAPVFLLPHAFTASARPNQTGPEQGQVALPATPCAVGVTAERGQVPPLEQGTHVNSKQKQSFSVAAASSQPRPVDNSAAAIAADFLNKLSHQLGYPILHRCDDPRLAQWVEDGQTFDAIETATVAALAARQRDGSRAPLNPGFIARFLPSQDDWRQRWSGIVAKGAALGMTQHPGETCPAYKARVLAAADPLPLERTAP